MNSENKKEYYSIYLDEIIMIINNSCICKKKINYNDLFKDI